MKATLPVLIILLTGGAALATDFPVADFGATGDGKTDDGAAIQKAVDAAATAGPGSRVVFEPKTYRLGWRRTAPDQISLAGATNIALEGNGAVLVSHPRNNLISLRDCAGVSVTGFTVDYDPLPFTQGSITEVNAQEGWIDVRIQKGYRHPVEEYESLGLKPPGKDWGVVFDPVERHRRWDVPMHWFMKEVVRSPAGADTARVVFADEARKELANVRPGDRYVITFKYGNSGANVELSGCDNCRVEDFTVHMAKYGMTFAVVKSRGQNVFRRVRMTFKPGSDRLIVTPKDGFHCKENRVGPLIEKCFFEGLLDDSINISACPYWIKKIIAPGVYALSGTPVVGDRLTAFTPSRSEMVEGLVVKSVKPYAAKPKWSEVELDREVPNPGVNDTGDDFPGGPEKLKFTGMYNVDACGAGYVVRNCTFREQRRHAMLVRAPGGLIEGNTVDGVGGSGVYMANEIGSFYEGPVPQDCIIRSNVFRNTQAVPILVGSMRALSPATYAKNIRIIGNRIEGGSTACIRVFSVSGLEITGNTWSHNPAAAAVAPLSLANIVDEAISGNADEPERAAPAADPLPVSANSGAGDDAPSKKASSDAAITVVGGGLPIILAAPHGGRAAIPGVAERTGEGSSRFSPRSDLNTDILTEKLADALEQKLGRRPYVVIARFHRKYIDANRRPDDAFESASAKATYEAYHAAITSACTEVTARWGRGVVLDIHGQAAQPDGIFRGTQNGKTITHLISRSGHEAAFGETSLFGQLTKQGFAVLPAVGSSDRETKYTGGHTVAAHGSSSGGMVDAIQLELGGDLRDAKTIADVADKMGSAIAAFAKSHLPAEEQKPTARIAVGVYLDKGSGPGVNDLLRALGKCDQVSVTKLTAEQIRSGGLAGLDILMCPGGSGGDQGRNLDEPGREKIRSFVREGGGYIGICAGAYLASAHYAWSLNLLDAKVIDTKHWNRGVGTVDIELTPAGRELLRATNRQFSIHYAQGPLLAPANKPEIEDYEELASFKTEIAENGAPAGVMTGTTAIARGRFGQGRVICFSPHPEMIAGLEWFVQDAIDYVKRIREAQD